MRLNFSGSDDAEIEEGVRRIGKVIREQVELYSTLTGEHPVVPAKAQQGSARPGMPGREAEDMPGIDPRPNPPASQSDSSEADSVVLPFRKEESA
jgi:hypothetical protein